MRITGRTSLPWQVPSAQGASGPRARTGYPDADRFERVSDPARVERRTPRKRLRHLGEAASFGLSLVVGWGGYLQIGVGLSQLLAGRNDMELRKRGLLSLTLGGAAVAADVMGLYLVRAPFALVGTLIALGRAAVGTKVS